MSLCFYLANNLFLNKYFAMYLNIFIQYTTYAHNYITRHVLTNGEYSGGLPISVPHKGLATITNYEKKKFLKIF